MTQRWLRRNVVLLVTLAGMACDPGYEVKGRVLTRDRKPLADHAVTLECPEAEGAAIHRRVSDRTDESGSFVFGGVGCLSRSCTVSSDRGERVALGRSCKSTSWLCRCSVARVTLLPRE